MKLYLNRPVMGPDGEPFTIPGKDEWLLRDVFRMALDRAPLEDKGVLASLDRFTLAEKLNKDTLQPTPDEAKILQDSAVEVFGVSKAEANQGKQGANMVAGAICLMLRGCGENEPEKPQKPAPRNKKGKKK